MARQRLPGTIEAAGSGGPDTPPGPPDPGLKQALSKFENQNEALHIASARIDGQHEIHPDDKALLLEIGVLQRREGQAGFSTIEGIQKEKKAKVSLLKQRRLAREVALLAEKQTQLVQVQEQRPGLGKTAMASTVSSKNIVDVMTLKSNILGLVNKAQFQ